MAQKVHKTLNFEIEEKADDGGRIRISTVAVDRDRDRVLPSGALIDNYMKNPVVQWGHNYRDPWAVIGRTEDLSVNETDIVAEFTLREPANETDMQNIVLLLWRGQFVRAASLGFIPKERQENEFGGFDFTVWELLEWSLTPIPSNQQALRLAAKALGLEEDPHTKELLALIDKAERVTKTLGELLQQTNLPDVDKQAMPSSLPEPSQPDETGEPAPHQPDPASEPASRVEPEPNNTEHDLDVAHNGQEPDTVPQSDNTPSTANAEPDDDPQPTADGHDTELSTEELAAVTARLAEFMDAVSTYIN